MMDKIREAYEEWLDAGVSSELECGFGDIFPRFRNQAIAFYGGYQSAHEEIERLKKMYEDSKCCGNCEHAGPYEEDWWPCETCNRSNGMGYKDNWEPNQ